MTGSPNRPGGGDILIGVVLPTYNRPDGLRRALLSLCAQTYGSWIVAVVNDASAVSYDEVEQEFAEDERVIFSRKETNEGVNATQNVGLDIVLPRGVDYITTINDDDVFAPDYFEVAIRVIGEHPGYGWYWSNNYGEMKASSRRITHAREMDFIDDYMYRKFRGDKATLISTELLGETRFDGRFRKGHRWMFFLELCKGSKIWAHTHDSVKKSYLEGGNTKGGQKHPKNWDEVSYKFARHWYVIRQRPLKLIAWRYLVLELFKTPSRLVRIWRSRLSSG